MPVAFAASRLLGTARAERLLQRAKKKARFDTAREGYGRFLDWVLVHRWVVILGVLVMLGITGGLATLMPTNFMARGDHSHLELEVETAIGNTLAQTHKEVREVEEVIARAKSNR